MASFTEIAAKIAKLFVATDKYHAIVNGPDNATVVVDSGVLPTFAKTIKDFNANLPIFTNRKLVFVSKMGSATDNRAGLTKYNSFKPFLTIAAAINAAAAGEVVVVMDGVFEEHVVMKNLVDVYFTEFATLRAEGNNYDDTAVLIGANVSAGVYGKGIFELNANSNYSYLIRQVGTNANLTRFEASKATVDLNEFSSDPYRGAALLYLIGGTGAVRDLIIDIDKIIMKREHSASQTLVEHQSTNLNLIFKAKEVLMPAPLYSGYSYGSFVNVGGTTAKAQFHIDRFIHNQIAYGMFNAQGGARIRYFGKEVVLTYGDSGSFFYVNATSAILAEVDVVKITATFDNGYTIINGFGASKSKLKVGYARLYGGASIANYNAGWHIIGGYYWVHQGPGGNVRGIHSNSAGGGSIFLSGLQIDMNDIYGNALYASGGDNYSFVPQYSTTNAQISLSGGSLQGGGTMQWGSQFYVEDWNF